MLSVAILYSVCLKLFILFTFLGNRRRITDKTKFVKQFHKGFDRKKIKRKNPVVQNETTGVAWVPRSFDAVSSGHITTQDRSQTRALSIHRRT
jgi:hypothetical protein